MQPFELVTVTAIPDAVRGQASSPTAQQGAPIRFIAGGTNLVDYMKLNVETPRQLIDINGLPLDKVEANADGGLKTDQSEQNDGTLCMRRSGCQSDGLNHMNQSQCEKHVGAAAMDELHCLRVLKQVDPPWVLHEEVRRDDRAIHQRPRIIGKASVETCHQCTQVDLEQREKSQPACSQM